jgi:hypothetical protein
MDRAFVLTLVEANERLQERIREFDKRIVQSTWDFLEHSANLSMHLNKRSMGVSSWYYDHIYITTLVYKGAEQTEECAKFVKKMNLPEDTNSILMRVSDVEDTYIHNALGTSTILASGIAKITIYDKDGFDIMYQIIEHCANMGRPIPIRSPKAT